MRAILTEEFYRVFKDGSKEPAPRVFFAPGRVNLLGEHTDYNGGLVLPCALDMGTYAVIRRREDNVIRLASGNASPLVQITLDGLAFDSAHGWGNYPKGVVFSMLESHDLSGFDMYFWGNLPQGAGLSSSASLSMVTALALNKVFGLEASNRSLVEICQKAENYNGVNCGIMDPAISVFGKENHALLLHCGSMKSSYIPLELGDYRIVLANTNKPHALADSKYNERRAECQEALQALQARCRIENLCDLTPEQFEEHKSLIKDDIPRKRAEHAIYENNRVKKGAKYIANGDWKQFMLLTVESHSSLRDLYEVCCDELNAMFLAAFFYGITPGNEPIYACRMTGAGFGGCTLNIVHKDSVEDFTHQVASYYQHETGLEATFYTALVGDGAREV